MTGPDRSADRLPPATEPPPTPPLPDGTPTGPDHVCECGKPVQAHDSLARCVTTDRDPATTAGHLHPCGCVAPSVNTLTLSNYQRGYHAGRAEECRRWVDAYWNSRTTTTGFLPRWIRDLLGDDGD